MILGLGLLGCSVRESSLMLGWSSCLWLLMILYVPLTHAPIWNPDKLIAWPTGHRWNSFLVILVSSGVNGCFTYQGRTRIFFWGPVPVFETIYWKQLPWPLPCPLLKRPFSTCLYPAYPRGSSLSPITTLKMSPLPITSQAEKNILWRTLMD